LTGSPLGGYLDIDKIPDAPKEVRHMRRWLILKTFAFMTAKFADGDCDLVLKLMADDVRFIFPGTSSFATDVTGKAGVERWIRRFVAMHPSYEILDVMVSGPPWNTRVGVRMRDRIGDD
jgi:SnoaL-like domain